LGSIEVFDDIFNDIENQKLFNTLINGGYKYGERDNPEDLPTGMVMELTDETLVSFLVEKIYSCKPDLRRNKPDQAYVNLFIPNENPNFHTDGKTTTCLFYVMPTELPLKEGGETQFFADNTITGILPKPKRLVVFDGMILHKATSFRSYPRYTIAIKFSA